MNRVTEIDDQIGWVLNHPRMSPWLKTTLGTALECDPLAVVNDLEILNLLLRRRCDALVHEALPELPANLHAGAVGPADRAIPEW
ncbi:hypothetical protein [Roseicella aquatilis]|uniref:hypothetical protein n=1 Tax=Roseicella aquatilis TaxID=2527868 RepID=UPI001981E6DC|nr:hypothetical protein [Roseicella aquatilis]